MDKEYKIIIISKEALHQKVLSSYNYSYNFKNQNREMEKNIQRASNIILYDITHSLKHEQGEKIYIKDHINKTGKNPLLKTQPINFVDLTSLYTKKKNSIITTSIGEKYNLYKKQFLFPSTDIALMSILCKKLNPKAQIAGILINCL